MQAKHNEQSDTITLEQGSELLESLYSDNFKKPVFIDLIYKMSTKLGTYRKQQDGTYAKTEEICGNISVLATLNIEEY